MSTRPLVPAISASCCRSAFIGNQLKKDLFGDDDAIGKTVLVNGSPFQIVGVLKEKSQDSSYSGRDHSKMMIPSTTYRALTGEKYSRLALSVVPS